MASGTVHRRKLILFIAITIASVSIFYARILFTVPGEIILIEGEDSIYRFSVPFLVSIKADRDGIIKLSSGGEIQASDDNLQLSNPVSLKSQKHGSVNLNIRLFGLIPIRTTKVDVVADRRIAACGNTVGVKLIIDGVLVIGVSDVDTADGKKVLPAKDTAIKPGDILVEVNNTPLESIDDLIDEIDRSMGKTMELKYRRGKVYSTVRITPVKSSDDNRYHIGLWVRDSTAGIGTLTFYDPGTGSFGALGHGITDIDTGTLMPVEKGEILESNILGVKRGRTGMPGELKGVFLEDGSKLGVISRNSDHGIYGQLSKDAISRLSSKMYSVGTRSQVREGPAIILSNIDGKKVEEFSIEIQKVSRQNVNSSKGMIIKVTDKRLLDATGGIVQGMSGSPIIQDGKIVGAVTHVLVNDPSRGYGIFIEGMLKNLQPGGLQEIEAVG